MHLTITFNSRQYCVIYVAIYGGSGMGANEPYNGRYYLASPDMWMKEKDNFCMVHDSILPRAWAYYDKNGIFLVEDNQYPGRVTPEVLMECLSRLDPEILAKFEAEKML